MESGEKRKVMKVKHASQKSHQLQNTRLDTAKGHVFGKGLKLIVSSENTSTSNGTQDIGSGTLEKGLVALLLDNLAVAIERRLVLDSLSRGHHHTAADSVNGISNKASQVGHTKAK